MSSLPERLTAGAVETVDGPSSALPTLHGRIGEGYKNRMGRSVDHTVDPGAVSGPRSLSGIAHLSSAGSDRF